MIKKLRESKIFKIVVIILNLTLPVATVLMFMLPIEYMDLAILSPFNYLSISFYSSIVLLILYGIKKPLIIFSLLINVFMLYTWIGLSGLAGMQSSYGLIVKIIFPFLPIEFIKDLIYRIFPLEKYPLSIFIKSLFVS